MGCLFFWLAILGLLHNLPFYPLPPLQFRNRLDDRLPSPLPVQVAAFQPGVRLHGCLEYGILAVFFDEQGGRSVDVDTIHAGMVAQNRPLGGVQGRQERRWAFLLRFPLPEKRQRGCGGLLTRQGVG